MVDPLSVPPAMNTPSSTISVIIVNYNSGGYLKRCVESVRSSNRSFQLILVDNASSDDSLKRVKESFSDEDTIIIENEHNVGFATAVNIGFRQSKGDHILLLNPDCVVKKDTLDQLSTALSELPKTGIVGALVRNEDGSEQRGCRRNEPTFKRSVVTTLKLGRWFEGVDLVHKPLPESPQAVDAVSGAAMMIKRVCFESSGGMDEHFFLHCEDLDICRSVRNLGYRVMFCPQIEVIHRQGASDAPSFFVERHKHQGMVYYHQKHKSKRRFDWSYPLIVTLVTLHFWIRHFWHYLGGRQSAVRNK